jgi:cytochrome c2
MAALLLAGCGSEPLDDTEKGQRIFSQNCTGCHSTRPGQVIVGPSLAGVGERAETRVPELEASDYIRQSILDPEAYTVDGFPNLMPTNFRNRFSDEQLDLIIGYLLTLEE